MSTQRRVTAPPRESAEAVTNSMRADNSPDRMQIPSDNHPVISPQPGRDGTALFAQSPGFLSFSSDLFR